MFTTLTREEGEPRKGRGKTLIISVAVKPKDMSIFDTFDS